MAKRILTVRVRPTRVAVLLARTAPQEDLLLGLKFLSRLWGGRFCQLLAVEPAGGDPLASFRLSQSRPDFVYGIGIDHVAWNDCVARVCQPRGYWPLSREYVEKLHLSVEEHVTATRVVDHLRRTPVGPGHRERALRLVRCDPKSQLAPFVASLYGIPYENLTGVLPHQEEWTEDAIGIPGFVAQHTSLVVNYARCWLDLASHGLTPRISHWGAEVPPTVVLVGSLAPDLALFWDLRMAADPDLPVWVIPLPVALVSDPVVPTRLKEWLLAFQAYGRRPNFCRVTSVSVPKETLTAFASRLQQELEDTPVRHVDVWEPTNRLPVVIAYESVQELTAELSRRTMNFHPPRPQLLEGVRRGTWMVDLVEDVRRKRTVKDLCLPPRPSAFAVLNAPGPTSIPMTRIPVLGDGADGLNICCSEGNESVSVYLPTAEEILEEVLREAGITPAADEKRACYLPVMRMFGDLDQAAEAFSGQRGRVLQALRGGPLQVGEILGQARLGKGKLPELAQPDVPREWLSQLHPAAKRTFWRRRREAWTRLSPSTTEVESLLEFWADKGIVSREWHLGPCPACTGSFWEPRLDIARPVSCPGCGSRLLLPPRVPMGYSLHRLVGHALREGVIPVTLAGRFLRRMTCRGFLWMPGVKYSWNGKDGDLDLLACCDGQIVVGECKTLDGTPPETGFWEVIFEQFAATVEVGKACRAAFAVLAVMADRFPEGFQGRADKVAGRSMPCLLLNRQDLEQGYRPVNVPGVPLERELSIRDLVVEEMPEVPRPEPAEARVIQAPAFSVAYGL